MISKDRAGAGAAMPTRLRSIGRGGLAERTGAKILLAAKSAIHTPIADRFLDGITRRTVIDLARRRGIEVIECCIFCRKS